MATMGITKLPLDKSQDDDTTNSSENSLIMEIEQA
jgi:hypothetical protein